MQDTNKKIALVILDGWGIGAKDSTNPLYVAKLPNLDTIKANFPCISLESSGFAIGLPWNEEGNSEIGHLTIGAGRTVSQTVMRINTLIKDGSFFKNKALVGAFENAKSNNTSVCFVGMIGNGMTHSSLEHLMALINMAKKYEVDFKLHLFTDGRDSMPKDCLSLLSLLPQDKIGSISGRFYAMDRDNHLNRTEESFKAMIHNARLEQIPPIEYINKSYISDITDEFIRPASFNKDLSIKKEDSIIFFNFRRDRMRQISLMFRKHFPDTHMVSFTKYEPDNNIQEAFALTSVSNPLPQIIADHGITQLRIAESEKRAHITYFFNGEREDPYINEFRIILPSKRIVSHDLQPEMMAKEITVRAVTAIEENLYGFILINYANPDMVAHTGNFNATIKAVEFIDRMLEQVIDACLKNNTILIITSDHGNAEKLVDTRTGEKDTKHNPSPVPFIVIDKRLMRKRTIKEIEVSEKTPSGSLCDIAPTILRLMRIEKPKDMTGEDLSPYLV